MFNQIIAVNRNVTIHNEKMNISSVNNTLSIAYQFADSDHTIKMFREFSDDTLDKLIANLLIQGIVTMQDVNELKKDCKMSGISECCVYDHFGTEGEANIGYTVYHFADKKSAKNYYNWEFNPRDKSGYYIDNHHLIILNSAIFKDGNYTTSAMTVSLAKVRLALAEIKNALV